MSELLRAVEGSVALRPMRLIGDELREYTATTFPADPWAGCNMCLRHLSAFGMVQEGSDLLIDVLDENWDIIQDVGVTREGFEYLRRKLKFKVETGGP